VSLSETANKAFPSLSGSVDVPMERVRGTGRVNDFSEDAEKSVEHTDAVDPLLQPAAPRAASPGSRLVCLDLFKGIIMALMAVDHAKRSFVSATDPAPFELYFQPADYAGPAGWWLTRLMTHTVAVGFAFALGVGFFFLFESRARLGWSHGRLLRFYALRAGVL